MKFNYCPNCGSKLDGQEEPQTCQSCGHVHYHNPKPTVTVLPVKDGKVLLCVRGHEPKKGAIDIVGGFLEYGEDPKEGARREAKEETGLDIEPEEILCSQTDTYEYAGINHSIVTITYLAKIISGEAVAGDDADSLMWVPIKDLPVQCGFESSTRAITALKDWYQTK